MDFIFERRPDNRAAFDVSIRIFPSDAIGLATYNIALTGLDDSPLDPTTFSWTQNNLENFNAAFMPQGIQVANLLASNVGTDGYSAANGQFNSSTAVFGIGIEPIEIEDNAIIPTDSPINLGVPALLGTLELPGSEFMSRQEIQSLLAPNAALFISQETSVAVLPSSVRASFNYFLLPEPSAGLLAVFGLGAAAMRRSRVFESGRHHPTQATRGGG